MSESALFTAVETNWPNKPQGDQTLSAIGVPVGLRRPREDKTQPAGRAIRRRRSHASWKRQESENIAVTVGCQRRGRSVTERAMSGTGQAGLSVG